MIEQQRHVSVGAGLATVLAVAALACANFTRAQECPAQPARISGCCQMSDNSSDQKNPTVARNRPIPYFAPANDIPAPDSVEGQLESEEKHWARTRGQMAVGTYVQDILAGRLNQPKGRGQIGKVASLAVNEDGRTVASVDFGRGYAVGIDISELSPIRFIETAKPAVGNSASLEGQPKSGTLDGSETQTPR